MSQVSPCNRVDAIARRIRPVSEAEKRSDLVNVEAQLARVANEAQPLHSS